MLESNQSKPLVSIVLPTYNRAHVLPHAIHSVLQQTYPNFELIIVDDNSPDNTAEVIKSFDDNRIKYVKNDPNLKLPRALNKGFSVSMGKYLTWTSDDNMYTEQAIEKMVEALKKQDCGFVFADYYEFAEQDKESGLPLDPRHEKLPDIQQLARANRIGACFMYTREVYEKIGEYDPELFLVEDYDYFIRIAKEFSMCHIAEPLYYFRRDDDTLYYSRFTEVKASDILIRYKNGLINQEGAVNAVVALLMQNVDNINNTIINKSYRFAKKLSYRLACRFERLISQYITRVLSSEIKLTLTSYSENENTFKESRDILCKLMDTIATIQAR